MVMWESSLLVKQTQDKRGILHLPLWFNWNNIDQIVENDGVAFVNWAKVRVNHEKK